MKNLNILMALAAGLAFGLWPILMRKGNVEGLMQSLLLSGFTVVAVVIFNLWYPPQMSGIKPYFAIAGAIVATIGILFYTIALSRATEPKMNISTVVLLQIIVQAMVPVLFQVMLDGVGISKEKITGMILGVLAVVLLIR